MDWCRLSWFYGYIKRAHGLPAALRYVSSLTGLTVPLPPASNLSELTTTVSSSRHTPTATSVKKQHLNYAASARCHGLQIQRLFQRGTPIAPVISFYNHGNVHVLTKCWMPGSIFLVPGAYLVVLRLQPYISLHTRLRTSLAVQHVQFLSLYLAARNSASQKRKRRCLCYLAHLNLHQNHLMKRQTIINGALPLAFLL